MNSEMLNAAIREVLNQLINDGHKANQICALTLGHSSIPQFSGFIKDKDLGIKPLDRFVDAFGHRMMLVPVKNDDTARQEELISYSNEFIEKCREGLIDGLANMDTMPARAKSINPIFAEKVKEIFKSLGIEPEVIKE